MKPIGTEALPLFDAEFAELSRRVIANTDEFIVCHEQETATEVGLRARDRTASRHAAEIEALIPLAQELAQRAGPGGVTVADFRLAAVNRGLLSGRETGRELSWLGKVGEAAGLVNTGRTRRSVIVKSHGNRHSIFVALEYAESAA